MAATQASSIHSRASASQNPSMRPTGTYVSTIFQFREWKPKMKQKAPVLNENNPLSMYYHADERLLSAVKSLCRNPAKIDKVHSAQKLLLDCIYIIYSDMDEESKLNRDYRRQLPQEDQQELDNGFSENILFAAEALSHGFRIRGIESFTNELIEPARQVCASMEALRFVFRSRALENSEPPYHNLWPVLRDFDKSWTVFEQKICHCYFTVMYKTKPATVDETDMLTILLSETILRALKNQFITTDQLADFDPDVMFAIPRLAIVMTLIHIPNCFNISDPMVGYRWFRAKQSQIEGITEYLKQATEREIFHLEYMLAKNDSQTQLPEGFFVNDQSLTSPPTTSAEATDEAAKITPVNPSKSTPPPLPSKVDVQKLFTSISSVADSMQSGPRARDFVSILHKVFKMHVPNSFSNNTPLSATYYPRRMSRTPISSIRTIVPHQLGARSRLITTFAVPRNNAVVPSAHAFNANTSTGGNDSNSTRTSASNRRL
ncbi:hypothetical protein BKA69DRAFT_1071007 [Paraphysoderma sedebokerense]|nr:hypothetical protein BKA69DRAFT_1071007 [Paraphysoderma sedebokerense]